MFMLCLFACAVYYVMLRMDTMWTKVSWCVDWASMSWFTCSLIQLTSFVVAVPVSHLRALSKKGNRLLLRHLLLFTCPSNEGSVFRRLIAEMTVGLQELYRSLIVVSSTCSGDIKWVSAAGQWLRNCNSWHVLSTCLLKYFQWHSRCPSDMCAVVIHEWCVAYVFKTGWKRTVLSITEISVYCIIKKYHTQWCNLKLNRVLARGQHISRC